MRLCTCSDSSTPVATLLALAVNDLSLRHPAIPQKPIQHVSPRPPASHLVARMPRDGNVFSERYFLRHRFVWMRTLCGPISSGYVFRIDR